jgi:hypothetical protein
MLEAENNRLRVEEQNRNTNERMRNLKHDNDQMKALKAQQLQNMFNAPSAYRSPPSL